MSGGYHPWSKFNAQGDKFKRAPTPKDRLFQMPFPDQVWDNIRKFLDKLFVMPLWVNIDMSETIFGGKQNNGFWKRVFETGRTPQGMEVLAKPINLIEMIK